MSFREYLEEHYVVREVSGGTQIQLSGECPFCGTDRDDLRLYISTENDLGYCQHCSKGFNPLGFVMAREGCDRKTASHILKGLKGGYVVTPTEKASAPDITPWPSLVDVFDYPAAVDYLRGRGLSDDLIRRHRIHFCVKNMTHGETTYRTSNRVIIPIYDVDGNPVGWQGRDITGKSRIKYLFPPNFTAGDHLFNVDRIANEARDYIILSEGTFDVFGWERLGVKSVAATFGKKIGDRQIDILLSIGVKTILLAWDSDAGWERNVFCEKYGHLFQVKIVDLSGRDADEVSPSEAVTALANATGYSWEKKILAAL